MSCSGKYLGSCEEFRKKFIIICECCSSCHTDENEGYSLRDFDTEEGYYEICCSVVMFLEHCDNRNYHNKSKKMEEK